MQDWCGRVLGCLCMHGFDFSGHTAISMLITKFCSWAMWPFVLPLMWFGYILMTTALLMRVQVYNRMQGLSFRITQLVYHTTLPLRVTNASWDNIFSSTYQDLWQ